MDEFQHYEKAERDYFSALSLAVRDSQEKERAQAEKSKYWSIIGSICGAVIGIVGTSINNWARMRELRRLMTEGPQEHHYKIRSDLEVSLSKQEQALNQFLRSLQSNRGNDGCDHRSLADQTRHLISLLEQTRFDAKDSPVLNENVSMDSSVVNETAQALRTLTFLTSMTILVGVITLVANFAKG